MSPVTDDTLTDRAIAVLRTAEPREKANAARYLAADWAAGAIAGVGAATPPPRPSRPARPDLLPPARMPRRRINRGIAGRVALLHALAHIELNAIDLAVDIVARFAREPRLPAAFFDDWIGVAADEARHFLMLEDRLVSLGAAYGDLAAHDGLWEAAENTAGDLLARLAVVPLVLEARGLDVTPAMIEKLMVVEDPESAAILQAIHDDEISHVAAGRRWFEHLCAARGLDPVASFHNLVRRYFRGDLKPPFNTSSRAAAGLAADYYEPLSAAR